MFISGPCIELIPKMSSCSAFALFRINKLIVLPFQLSYPKKNYAKKDTGAVSMLGGMLKKKKLGKVGPIAEKKVLPVETDPQQLVTYCCGSNIYKTGEDVKLKPDNEYPDWLWNVRLGPPPRLEELDPNTKAYWRRLRKLGIERNLKLKKLRKF